MLHGSGFGHLFLQRSVSSLQEDFDAFCSNPGSCGWDLSAFCLDIRVALPGVTSSVADLRSILAKDAAPRSGGDFFASKGHFMGFLDGLSKAENDY